MGENGFIIYSIPSEYPLALHFLLQQQVNHKLLPEMWEEKGNNVIFHVVNC